MPSPLLLDAETNFIFQDNCSEELNCWQLYTSLIWLEKPVTKTSCLDVATIDSVHKPVPNDEPDGQCLSELPSCLLCEHAVPKHTSNVLQSKA